MTRPLAALAMLVLAAGAAFGSSGPQIPHTIALPAGTVLGSSTHPVASADGVVGFVSPARGGLVIAFSIVTGKVLGSLPGSAPARGIAIFESPGRRMLAITSSSEPATITVVDALLPSEMRVESVIEVPAELRLTDDAVATFVRDGQYAVVSVAGPVPALVTFDLKRSAQSGALPLGGEVSSIHVSETSEGCRVLGVSGGLGANAVFVSEIGHFGEVLPLSEFAIPGGHLLSSFNNVVTSTSGRLGYVATTTGSLFSFDVVTGRLVSQLSIDGTPSTVRMHAGQEEDRLALVTLAPVSSNERSAPGAFVIDVLEDGSFRPVRSMRMSEGDAPTGLQSAEFSADGKVLVVPATSALYFVNLESGDEKRMAVDAAAGRTVAAPLANSIAVLTSSPNGDRIEIVPFEEDRVVETAAPPRHNVVDPTTLAPLAANRLAPSSVIRGRGQILHVSVLGSGFRQGARALLNRTSYATTVSEDGTRAEVAIPGEQFLSGSKITISIANVDGARTAPLDLYILDPNSPVVGAVSVVRTRAGVLDVRLDGDHFRDGSVVRMEASGGRVAPRIVDLKTYRLSFTRIVAEMPDQLARSATAFSISVLDRDGVTVSASVPVDVPKLKAHKRSRRYSSAERRRLARMRAHKARPVARLARR